MNPQFKTSILLPVSTVEQQAAINNQLLTQKCIKLEDCKIVQRVNRTNDTQQNIVYKYSTHKPTMTKMSSFSNIE